MPEIIYCKNCIHRPYLDEDGCVRAPTIDGRTDYICPFICDDSYYNRTVLDDFFCGNGEKQEYAVLIKNFKMPLCCDDCDFLNEDGDYPLCLITHHSRGYNFNTRENRMSDCPLILVEKQNYNGNSYYTESGE